MYKNTHCASGNVAWVEELRKDVSNIQDQTHTKGIIYRAPPDIDITLLQGYPYNLLNFTFEVNMLEDQSR